MRTDSNDVTLRADYFFLVATISFVSPMNKQGSEIRYVEDKRMLLNAPPAPLRPPPKLKYIDYPNKMSSKISDVKNFIIELI